MNKFAIICVISVIGTVSFFGANRAVSKIVETSKVDISKNIAIMNSIEEQLKDLAPAPQRIIYIPTVEIVSSKPIAAQKPIVQKHAEETVPEENTVSEVVNPSDRWNCEFIESSFGGKVKSCGPIFIEHRSVGEVDEASSIQH